MERGYIKLYRCIVDNHFWQDKPFDLGRAWVDLILLANHKEACLWKRGIKIIVSRGQVGLSERELAKRWGWSRGKVERFLKNLKNEHQIDQQNGPQNINITSLITIINYDKYQTNEPQNEPQNGPQTGHRRATDSTMNKNVKNVKKESIGENRFEICIAWNAFVEMRKKIKKPMTEYAMHLRVKDLMKLQEQGQDPVAVLNQSTAGNWQDLYPVKEKELPAKQDQAPLSNPAASAALKRKLEQYAQ